MTAKARRLLAWPLILGGALNLLLVLSLALPFLAMLLSSDALGLGSWIIFNITPGANATGVLGLLTVALAVALLVLGRWPARVAGIIAGIWAVAFLVVFRAGGTENNSIGGGGPLLAYWVMLGVGIAATLVLSVYAIGTGVRWRRHDSVGTDSPPPRAVGPTSAS
jgi:hypothetical protein